MDYVTTMATLTFTSSTSRIPQRVSILADNVDEPEESFLAQLTRRTQDSRVTVSPERATISILDNNGKPPETYPLTLYLPPVSLLL